MEQRQYTTKELTDYFRVSRYAIQRAINSGALPVAGKRGVENLFNEEDVLNYIESSKR